MQVLRQFIDEHLHTHGVEPICKVLQIAQSSYRRHAAQKRNPDLRCARAKLHDTLKPEIQRVWQANMRVYGADKVWKQMRRERITQATLHRRAADETLGLARCQARQGGTHDHWRYDRCPTTGPGQPAIQG